MMIVCLSLIATGCRNLHEVESGKVFRSGQLDSQMLIKLIEKTNIKTIINLRGESVGADWYDNEKAIADEYGLELVNIPMSASRIPRRRDLLKLFAAFDHSTRPVLVHCRAGADRTGEAMAIYQWQWMGKSKGDARKMLSKKYGHIKKFKPAKDYFFNEVFKGVEWAIENYYPCKANYKYFDKSKLCDDDGNEIIEESEVLSEAEDT